MAFGGVGRMEACLGSLRTEKREGNTQSERYLRRNEDSVKTGRKEIVWENSGSVHLAQDRHP